MQSHIHKVYACLAVTCYLHFWHNDQGLLCATAVTWGWNGYRNKSQHRKSTLEKKISRRSCRDSNPRPFSHESGALTTELSPVKPKQNRIRTGHECYTAIESVSQVWMPPKTMILIVWPACMLFIGILTLELEENTLRMSNGAHMYNYQQPALYSCKMALGVTNNTNWQ